MSFIDHLKNWATKSRNMGLSWQFPRIKLAGLRGFFLQYDVNSFSNSGNLRGYICCIGKNNKISIADHTYYSGKIRIEGSNNSVEIGSGCFLKGEILIKGDHQKVIIGDRTRCLGVRIICIENRNVTIGKDCLFSRNIEIRTSDAHGIFDRITGERLNPAADVVIDDHVWLGVGVIVIKGAHIPADSVVGARSFVNKDFSGQAGVVLAGAPARIVRTGINWSSKPYAKASRRQLKEWRAGK